MNDTILSYILNFYLNHTKSIYGILNPIEHGLYDLIDNIKDTVYFDCEYHMLAKHAGLHFSKHVLDLIVYGLKVSRCPTVL